MLKVWKQQPQDQRVPKTSAGSSAWSTSTTSSGNRASYRKTRKASSPSSSIVGDTTPLEETVETDSERGD
ncbi:hypothetical protein Taro_000462 [Colocasia esculenta]|uniref:Uncharacterized protein n=1 Tax=Colocasia esculenta TaxID=4460 RepID=A0A843TD37_COLES|nr:hypothetical protein [Colocasia esculenta]